jgi:hypothetical protein
MEIAAGWRICLTKSAPLFITIRLTKGADMPSESDRIQLTDQQLKAIKKRLKGKYLKADEAALLEGLLEMATLHPDRSNTSTAWHYMIPK